MRRTGPTTQDAHNGGPAAEKWSVDDFDDFLIVEPVFRRIFDEV